jgi:DNA processing protein
MPIQHWLQLSLAEGLGPILIGRLIQHAGSARAATAISPAELQEIEGIGSGRARTIHDSLHRAADETQRQLDRAGELGAMLVCPEDGCYPELLRHIQDPPAVLYVLGALEPRDLQAIAMVGSRRCSHYGREQAERFGALLAGAGYTIVSGGARGIDSASHRGALSHPHGRTIVVLGCGIDVTYPPENRALFAQIAGRGAVITEYPPGTPPSGENFPRRNRIVSGMSRAVLVIEADQRSGALITARLANEDHGRPVFALPGRVDNPLTSGPHQLIRDGATLVTGIEDIQEGLDPLPASSYEPGLFPEVNLAPDQPPAEDKPAAAPAITTRQSILLERLDRDGATVDQLVDRTGLEAAQILQELTFLSLKGLVRRLDGQTYARGKA